MSPQEIKDAKIDIIEGISRVEDVLMHLRALKALNCSQQEYVRILELSIQSSKETLEYLETGCPGTNGRGYRLKLNDHLNTMKNLSRKAQALFAEAKRQAKARQKTPPFPEGTYTGGISGEYMVNPKLSREETIFSPRELKDSIAKGETATRFIVFPCQRQPIPIDPTLQYRTPFRTFESFGAAWIHVLTRNI